MKIRLLMGAIILMVMALLLSLSSDSFGRGGKGKQPSAEIVSATKAALSQRLFASDSDGPDEEDANFVVMYAFNPVIEKCAVCQQDMQAMFAILLFKSELVKQGKVSLSMITEADLKTTSEYLTNILAPVFEAQKIEPAKIDSYLQAIHLIVVYSEDFSDIKGAQLPVIGIIDTTKDEDEDSIYMSSGSAGPWSKFDQLILSKSAQ